MPFLGTMQIVLKKQKKSKKTSCIIWKDMLYLRSWRECWNWQTGKTKDLVGVCSCGFKSHLPHTYSSIAQSVEHAAVNRAVVGSSPTRGVMQKWRNWQTRTVQVRVVVIP